MDQRPKQKCQKEQLQYQNQGRGERVSRAGVALPRTVTFRNTQKTRKIIMANKEKRKKEKKKPAKKTPSEKRKEKREKKRRKKGG